jgi:hypothetical protein
MEQALRRIGLICFITLLRCCLAHGQVMQEPFVNTAALAASTNVTLDATVTPCGSTASSSVSTLTCSLGAVPAADLIVCASEWGDLGNSAQITDNVNSGVYTLGNYYVTGNGGYHEFLGYWYYPNTASGTTTATMTLTAASNSWGFGCGAFKSTRTTNLLDPSFYGMYDNGSATTAVTMPTSKTPTNNGELVYCIADVGVPSVSVTAGTNYTLIDTQTLDALWPYYWPQTTKTSTNCPSTIASSQVWSILAGAILPSSASAGITPYQGFFANFGGLTNAAVPTPELLTGYANVSGTPPGVGWFGDELDWYCCNSGSTTSGGIWSITNTHSDVTGSTSGPTGILSSTLYLPASSNTSGGAGVSSYYTSNGNQTMNLQLVTGTTGDNVLMTIVPSAATVNYGAYIEWDIPNNDTSGHSYTFFGPQGGTDYLMLTLTANGTTMTASMQNAFGSATLGTVSASTDGLWVTGQFVKGGTESMAIYTGCPTISAPSNTCSLLYSNTLSDTGSTNANQFFLGNYNGTQTASKHIWMRNVKMGPSYPVLP